MKPDKMSRKVRNIRVIVWITLTTAISTSVFEWSWIYEVLLKEGYIMCEGSVLVCMKLNPEYNTCTMKVNICIYWIWDILTGFWRSFKFLCWKKHKHWFHANFGESNVWSVDISFIYSDMLWRNAIMSCRDAKQAEFKNENTWNWHHQVKTKVSQGSEISMQPMWNM